MLKAAGLSETKEATYLALVRQGSASVTQLAEKVGLTVVQVRRAVAALQREGFVHRTPPPQELVVPVPPELAVEQFIKSQEFELERTRAAAQRLAAEAYSRPSSTARPLGSPIGWSTTARLSRTRCLPPAR